ncbi:MAG: radical SAM protein [Smithellaceae bacterium]|nr:radical SAM protein [Smithellaceae bacterium]
MKNTVLLVNPWIHDFAAYDFWIKPLGLLYLGALLRANGCRVTVVDCLNPFATDTLQPVRRPLPRRSSFGEGKFFKEEIKKPSCLRGIPRRYHRYGITPNVLRQELSRLAPPDVIMVGSMMTYWYTGVIATIEILKETFPGVPIVLGGNYVRLSAEHARANSGADLVVTETAEEALPYLLREFFHREASFLPLTGKLDSLPYPAFDLLARCDQVPVMTSRGCPFHCSYCASNILNPRFLRRDPICVTDEIQVWRERHGITNFSFYDDALLIRPDELIVPLLKEIIRRNLRCQFHCPNGLHLKEVTTDIAHLMFAAGFRTIRFGFETSDLDRQTETGGKANNDDLRRAVAYLKKAGYKAEDIGVYLLCGLPGQSADEVQESIDFVASCGARPVIAEYSPIPGTALWEAAVAHSPYPIADEPLFHNNTLLPCCGKNLTGENYQRLKLMTRSRGASISQNRAGV